MYSLLPYMGRMSPYMVISLFGWMTFFVMIAEVKEPDRANNAKKSRITTFNPLTAQILTGKINN